MKMDGRLARNPLNIEPGDALHAVMCGAGDNLRLILAALRLLSARFGLTMQAEKRVSRPARNRAAYSASHALRPRALSAKPDLPR